MPRKAHTVTDEERAKRIRETAREIETSDDPKDLERAFGKVVLPKVSPPKQDDKPKAKKG